MSDVIAVGGLVALIAFAFWAVLRSPKRPMHEQNGLDTSHGDVRGSSGRSRQDNSFGGGDGGGD